MTQNKHTKPQYTSELKHGWYFVVLSPLHSTKMQKDGSVQDTYNRKYHRRVHVVVVAVVTPMK
jgi:hypothetical protein